VALAKCGKTIWQLVNKQLHRTNQMEGAFRKGKATCGVKKRIFKLNLKFYFIYYYILILNILKN